MIRAIRVSFPIEIRSCLRADMVWAQNRPTVINYFLWVSYERIGFFEKVLNGGLLTTSMNRPSTDEYFMAMAKLAASRSTCLRRQVGAVIVKDKQIISTGYNGAPKDLPHCSEVGCRREELNIESGTRHELCRGVHAEQNAVIQAAFFGVSVKDAKLYSTHHPCVLCVKILINAGINRVVYDEGYPDDLAEELLDESDMVVEEFKGETEHIVLDKD